MINILLREIYFSISCEIKEICPTHFFHFNIFNHNVVYLFIFFTLISTLYQIQIDHMLPFCNNQCEILC